jgi:hypothetical protein
MIKAMVTDKTGKKLLMIGLSFGNLAEFVDKPLDTFIKIDGKTMDIDFDVLLFSGKTEEEMARFVIAADVQ